MKTLYLATNWVVSVMLLLAALIFTVTDVRLGLTVLVAALLFLPPARTFVHSKTNMALPAIWRAACVASLFGLFAVFIGQSAARDAEAQAEKEAQAKAEEQALQRKADVEYFNVNSATVLAEARAASKEREYHRVINVTTKYLDSGNVELKTLNTNAHTELAELQKAAAEKQRIAKERREKIESQFSKWNGAHTGLEQMIKASMHNPDSYEHVETRFAELGDHVIVTTKFRGTNGFGGIVTNSTRAKVNLDGRVLSIEEN